jgi:hypothetical protein
LASTSDNKIIYEWKPPKKGNVEFEKNSKHSEDLIYLSDKNLQQFEKLKLIATPRLDK